MRVSPLMTAPDAIKQALPMTERCVIVDRTTSHIVCELRVMLNHTRLGNTKQFSPISTVRPDNARELTYARLRSEIPSP